VWETRFLLREEFDIIACFGGTDLDHNFIASTFAPVPALICIRGMAVPLDIFNSIKYRLPQIKKIIAVSDAIKRVMVETGWVNPDKIAVVYPGLELDLFHLDIDRAAVRKSLGLAEDAPVVIIIDGYFKFTPENNKGGYFFVKAAEKIIAQKPKARFLIVGGSSVDRFNQLASPTVKEASILTQHRNDIPELLAASDVLVCASFMEGLGMVCAEALAMKKPVVGTEVGGIPELVRPGQTGILAPPRDGEAIAKAVLDLLDNPEKAREFGENGRKMIEEMCDNRKRVDRIEEIFYEEYEKAISKRKRK
jgi:glycosyltransferase involved in cell wall biosynthesis